MITFAKVVNIFVNYNYFNEYFRYSLLFILILNKNIMQETVKQRLVKYLKYKGIGQNRFENAAGISNGYISNLKTAPGANHLTKILNAAPDLNRVWLLTGEGDMLAAPAGSTARPGSPETQEDGELTPLRHSELQEYTTTKNGMKFYEREDGQIVMRIPVVPIAALGSPEDEFAELITDYDRNDTVTIIVDSVHHGKYTAFRVEGDSMDDGTYNGFRKGDVVAVRELARELWLPKLHYRKWPFWVVVFGNNIRLKQMTSQDEATGDITLHSLNPSPEYTDFTLRLDQISRLFNVVQHIPKPRTF